MRISLQPAFILHQRPYRETSVLLDVLTQDYGRLSLIARGVRKERSRLRAILQPFIHLLISFQGKYELMTLVTAESSGAPISLRRASLLSGFYLNELLVRVLQKQDAHRAIYTIYRDTLLELEQGELQQKTLRLFEKKLLIELGYGLRLQPEVFDPEKYYQFFYEQGLVACDEIITKERQSMIFSGKSLLAFAVEELNSEEILQDAKRLMRLALAPLLGSQPLHSRKLFIEVEKA